MIKTILKEGIIILLLCVAILLVLSVLFYDYNPINKVVPNKIESYTAPNTIKEELEEETIKNSLEIEDRVYTIEGSDLNIYKKGQSYNPSKDNPFATISDGSGNTTHVDSSTKVEDSGNNSGNSGSSSNSGNNNKQNTVTQTQTGNSGLK